MATSASTITTSNTLEEFRIQFNTLVNDVSVLDAGNIFGASIIFEGATEDTNETTLTVADPTADRTVTLPDATGTVITTGNSDAATTTTSVSDVDFVLVDDGGTLKKITRSNIGIGNNAADDITAGDAAVNITTTSGNITIDAAANNSDIIFKGTDASSDITMLTLDGSEAGAASFNGVVTADAGVVVDNITIDGTEIDLSSGDLTLDVAGDIILDADGADVIFKDGGTSIGTFTNSSSDFVISSNVSDKDILVKGNDGGSTITALTLDMSDAGAAKFNSNISPSSANGGSLGTASLEWSHLFLADGAVIFFGNDGDVTLTHIADTGLLLSDDSGVGTTQLQFGDSGTYIQQSANGVLELFSDTTLEINGDALNLKNTASNETYLAAANGGAVELYFNNSKKFETTNVGGTLTGNLTVSGEITANSDASLKENILPISNPLDIIDSIKGVQFNFKDRQKEDISYGFLAQEMEKILPSIVHETDPKQNTLGIAYNNIIAILLEGVKSLSDEVKELKNKIEK